MEQLYSLDANQKVLLSSLDTRIYLHTMQNEHFLRPTLLCSNYESDLSGVLYNNTLYYSYRNKEHSLLVRCLGEPSVLFRLDSTGASTYLQPQLTCFAGNLFLSYIEQADSDYVAKLRCLFTELPTFSLPFPNGSVTPQFHLFPTGTALYVFLTANTGTELFRYNTSLSLEKLYTESEAISAMQLPLEQKNAELAQQLSGLSASLTQTQNELSAKTAERNRLEAMLVEQSSNLHVVKQQLAASEYAHRRTQTLLERAKTQYEELMTVAERYREEALKWYGKFSDRH